MEVVELVEVAPHAPVLMVEELLQEEVRPSVNCCRLVEVLTTSAFIH